MAQIIVMDGPGSGTTYELDAVNNIGRGDNCNIKLQSGNISPLQAIIKKKASHYNIIGATAGSVLVNGQPIHKERKLIHGDMITLADIMLLYGEEPSGESPIVGQPQANADEPMITNVQSYYKDTNTAISNLDATKNASQNIKVLLKVSNAIMSKLEPKELLAKLLDIMFDEIKSVDRGMVLLKESDAGSRLWPMASKKRPNITQDVVPSRTIIKRVLQTKEGVLTEDAKGDYGNMAVSIVNQNIEAAICVPLVGKNNNILGIIHLDSIRQNQGFREDHLRLVTAIAMQASLAMENAILVKHLGEKQRMQRELDIANDIQMKLLPKNLPVTEGLEVYGLMKPAKEVGGDYYDFLIPENSNNRKLFICIGDVSGKGVPAGLVMVMARCFFRPLIISCKNTKMIIEEMNKFLVEDTRKDMFMSMLVLSWDADKEQIQWTGAGHEHIIVYRAQTRKCETIRAGGIVLGMMKKANRFFKDQYLTLQPGDTLILYTDGVTEAINPGKKMFELENLVTLCEKYGHLSAEQICKHLLDDLKRFMGNAPQHDDITLVAIKKK
ncbi:SpoIIE family protein phosphatase [Candidatus Uabimicrobium sp. HlEnr_7]|uniref:SpoIIE family protein phosphatase n=1 Tax=Candidatus Uabimicrobium helgolandensis TaxID=3095367 RepID=UPI00355913CE